MPDALNEILFCKDLVREDYCAAICGGSSLSDFDAIFVRDA